MKKMTVTIGIPAYNEEANIKELLTSLLAQKTMSFELKKIIVISDGSIDRTESIVQSMKNPKITTVTNIKRMGQTNAQNMIFAQAKTDIVVLMEADTLPTSNKYIETLITPLFTHPDAGLVQGKPRLLPSAGLIGKALVAQRHIYQRSLPHHAKNIFPHCSGRGGRAFPKKVYKQLMWPPAVPEDMFALLWCRKNSYTPIYEKNATTNYRGAQTFVDFLHELNKNRAARKRILKYFPSHETKLIYNQSWKSFLKMTITFIRTNPLLFFMYGILKTAALFTQTNDAFSDHWAHTSSTKSLVNQ